MFLIFFCTVSSFSAYFSGLGIGGHAGYVDPEPTEATLLLGGHLMLEWNLGDAGQVQWRPSGDFWTKDQLADNNILQTWIHFSLAPIEFNYHIPVDESFPFQAYIGAGMGGSLTFYTFEDENRDKDPEFGTVANLFGGLEINTLKVFIPFGELKLTVGTTSAVKIVVGLQIRSPRIIRHKNYE